MPLEDLLNTALMWSQGAHNDLYGALGPISPVGIFITGTLIVLCMAWGARVQIGLYSDQRLSWRAWWALSGSDAAIHASNEAVASERTSKSPLKAPANVAAFAGYGH